MGNLGEGKLLLITAIQLVDEMSLKGIMQKFKQHNKELEINLKKLKILSIQYKDDRDQRSKKS